MSYIGNSPGVASQRVETSFTATSGQTVFTPSAGYTLGYLDVYQNGLKLIVGISYTASNGVTFTLTTGATTGDAVVCVAYFPRGLSDGYLKSETDAKYVDLTSAQTITGVKTFSGATLQLANNSDADTSTTVSNTNSTGVSAGASVITTANWGNLYMSARGSGRTVVRYGVVMGGYGEISTDAGNGLLIGTRTAVPLILGTSNAERMRINSSGNVGIGTTSPNASANTTIKQGSSTYQLQLEQSNVTDGYGLRCNAADGALSFSRYASSAYTERMRIDSSGNVGIGTSGVNSVYDGVAQPRPLVVQSASATTVQYDSTNAIVICNSDTTTNNASQLNFAAITGASTNQYTSAVISCIYGTRTNTSYPAGILTFATSPVTQAPVERMRITSTGNVGIGTTAPSAKLDVRSENTLVSVPYSIANIHSTDAFAINKGGSLSFGGKYATDGSVQTFAAIAGRKEDAGDGSWAGYLQFVTGTTPTERMRIDSSGNVGIGLTPNASIKLQVAAATNITLGIANATTITGAVTLEAVNNARSVNIPMELRATKFDFTGPTTGVSIATTGNVGIGTTDTSLFNAAGGTTRLAVCGSSASTDILGNTGASISIINTDTTANNTAGLHFARADTDDTPNYAGASIVAQFPDTQVASQYPKGLLAFLTSTSANAAPSEKMRIDSTGNVGIGTTAPGVNLDVVGTSGARVKYGAGLGLLISQASSGGTANVNNQANASLIFGTNNIDRMTIDSSGNVLVTNVAGLGYGTGSGGTVTQATSKATGVTLNKPTGQITMNAAALTSATIVSFVLTNTVVAATDLILINHVSGGTGGAYTINGGCAAGGVTINVRNNTAGSLSEALVLSFAIIKGATS